MIVQSLSLFPQSTNLHFLKIISFIYLLIYLFFLEKTIIHTPLLMHYCFFFILQVKSHLLVTCVRRHLLGNNILIVTSKCTLENWNEHTSAMFVKKCFSAATTVTSTLSLTVLLHWKLKVSLNIT